MLGENSLGVLRVHLPGLVHRWHEITPWKCLVWSWRGSISGTTNGDVAGGATVNTKGGLDTTTAAVN